MIFQGSISFAARTNPFAIYQYFLSVYTETLQISQQEFFMRSKDIVWKTILFDHVLLL